MINIKVVIFFVFTFATFNMTSFAQNKSSQIKNLSIEADVILTGRVSQKEASWNSDKSRIYTKTTLQIDEYLKGDNNESSLEIITLGGEVDGVGELYSHMPDFKESEDVLVFLKKDKKNDSFKVLMGEEGKISVSTDNKSKEKMTSLNTSLRSLISQIKSYSKK